MTPVPLSTGIFIIPGRCGPCPVFRDGRQAIGINERFHFNRYEPGQYFAPQTDGPFRSENGKESRLTLLISLRHELLHEGRVDVMLNPAGRVSG